MTLHPLYQSPRRRTSASPVADVAADGATAPGTVLPVAVPGAPIAVRYHADSGVIVVDAYHCTWVNDTRGDGLWWVSAWATPHVRDRVLAVDTLCWLNAEAATVVRAMTPGRHLSVVS